MQGNNRRLNLNFNLDDPRHATAYNLLQASGRGREKTSVVVDAVLKQMVDGADKKTSTAAQGARLYEQVQLTVQQAEARCAELICKKSQMLLAELQELKNFSAEPILTIIDPAPVPESGYDVDDDGEIGISQDAFAAMMGL